MIRFGVTAAVVFGLVASSWATASATSADGFAAFVPHFTRAFTFVGRVTPSQPMRLVVHLSYPNSAAVDSFVRTVTNPASPMFGDYLTPDQFSRAFDPSPATYSTVIASLRKAGFRITGTYSNRKLIDVVADAARVQTYFHTTIGYFVKGRSVYYTNATPAYTPAALRGAVMSVSGFNNYSRMMPHISARYLSAQPFAGTSTNPGPYGPKDIQTAYNESVHVNPAINGTSSTGTHATIAIETAFDYQDSDLTGFWTMGGVTRAPGSYVYRKFVDNPTGQGIFNADESIETTADVEQTTSNAPGANVLIVEGVDNLTSTFDDVYASIVSDPRVDVVTTSWGLCEIDEDPNEVLSDSDLFKQGAAEGQTMFAASGDSGSKDCSDATGTQNTVTGVDFPSSSPWVGASGGTSMLLNTNGTINTDTGWSGSGGGVSVIFAMPSYQVPVTTLASTNGRNSPDVALLADNTTGYTFFYLGSGTVLKIGGTSLVAPNMAAIYAQNDGYFNKRLGLAQSGLYKMFASKTYPGKVFYDILTGSNGDYSCHAGYDNVTGPGSLNGYLYMTKVVPHSGSTPL